MPPFTEFAPWKVASHLSAVMTGRKFTRFFYRSSESWRNNACCAELFADKCVRFFAVVTSVGKECIKRLMFVSLCGGRHKFSVVGIRTTVGNDGDIKIVLGITNCGELWICTFLQTTTLTVIS